MTEIYRLDDAQGLEDDAFRGLVRAFQEGKIVAFPTDTVYGLGTSALDAEGIRRVYELKGRDSGKPLPIFVHSLKEARRWISFTPAAEGLALRHWPGPLTIVLNPTEEGRRLLSPGAETLAVRVPNSPIVLSLLEKSGIPWAATSANASGEAPLCDGRSVIAAFSGKVDCILAGGKTASLASTVVDARGRRIRILREGAIQV